MASSNATAVITETATGWQIYGLAHGWNGDTGVVKLVALAA